MILREWRAEVRRWLRDEYVDYVRETGLAAYLAMDGNVDAGIAVRDLDEERSEIVTLSVWQSEEHIRAFAGEDVGRAVYYSDDDRYLLTRPERVAHSALSGFLKL